MTANMPVYVKIEDYKEVLETMTELQVKIKSAKELLAQIEAIKSEEESELNSWRLGLEDVETKLSNLDTVLSDAR